MKGSELRIGNLVLHGDDVIKVNSIGDLFGGINEWSDMGMAGNVKYKNIKPIPLTEDILLKCGFEFWGVKSCNEFESYDRWVLHNVVGGTSNFEVHIIYSTYGGIKHKEICYSIDNDERQFIHETNFVHNLQNAYKTATGEELTINL